MAQESCSTCYCYKALANQCRRHHPVPFLAAVQPNGQGMVITAYPNPPQGKDDWCAEWSDTNPNGVPAFMMHS